MLALCSTGVSYHSSKMLSHSCSAALYLAKFSFDPRCLSWPLSSFMSLSFYVLCPGRRYEAPNGRVVNSDRGRPTQGNRQGSTFLPASPNGCAMLRGAGDTLLSRANLLSCFFWGHGMFLPVSRGLFPKSLVVRGE